MTQLNKTKYGNVNLIQNFFIVRLFPGQMSKTHTHNNRQLLSESYLLLSSTFGLLFFLKLSLDLILSPCFCKKDLDFLTFLLSLSSPSLPLKIASSLLMLDTEALLAISSLLLLTLSKEWADRIEFCFSNSPPLLVEEVARLLALCVLSSSAFSVCSTFTITTSSLTSAGGSGDGSGVCTPVSRNTGLGLGVSLVGVSCSKIGNWVLE